MKTASSCITWPISQCMDFSISSATTTKPKAQAEEMEALESRIMTRMDMPDPYLERDLRPS